MGLMGVTTTHGSRVQKCLRPEAALVQYSQISLDGATCPSQDFNRLRGPGLTAGLPGSQVSSSRLGPSALSVSRQKKGESRRRTLSKPEYTSTNA